MAQQKEEDFDLEEEDARKEVIDKVPTITFSNRVLQFITKRMSCTMIVKLLGRQVSYHTMANRL